MRLILVALLAGGLIAVSPEMPAFAQPAASTAGYYASWFWLGGDVQAPRSYTKASLGQLPSTKLDVYFNTGAGPVNASYTGVLLWDLLNISRVVVDPSIKNDILRKEVVVTGSDGYQAVFGLGEIAPQFGGEQIIVAYAQDGVPFNASSGFAKLIVPGDKTGGRAVSMIVRVRVVSVK